jgi:hypothetical protein
MECNMKATVTLIFSLFLCSKLALAQGSFQDLDFGAANVTGYTVGGYIPNSSAFPGWQTVPSEVVYDGISSGLPFISITDSKNPFGLAPINGVYGADLFAAGNVSASLSQTGNVPAGTESIQLDANQSEHSTFVIMLGGDSITMFPLQNGPDYTVYGGNVSTWAGQNTTLSITELPPSNPAYSPSLLQLDNITFSPTSVAPEPTPLALMGIGGLLFALYRPR